jgi:hypothetical protein
MKIISNSLELAELIKQMPRISGTKRLLPNSQDPITGPCHDTSELTPLSDSTSIF